MHLRLSAVCKEIPQAGNNVGPTYNGPESMSTSTSSLHPSSPMLPPFNCLKSAEEWAEADQALAESVVPAVLSQTSVEEKNHSLCAGIYTYFSHKFGTRAKRKRRLRKSHPSQASLSKLRKDRNIARNDLRKAKKQGGDDAAIQHLAHKFHHLLREHQKVRKVSGMHEILHDRRC